MSAKLARLRSQAFFRQQGRCCYCDVPMWMDNPQSFAQAHGITLAQARWHQCTAEHLLARQDGGPDSGTNVAAACKHCNLWRHRGKGHAPEPERYREIVRERMSRQQGSRSWVFVSPTLSVAARANDPIVVSACRTA